MAARRVTYQEYMEWAALRPRTNDWSALVAYDKDKCNHLLHQEYIQKFDSNSYMPPIDDTYATGETTWYWLNDYQTDVPRLSFENNPDGNGGNVAEANMSMSIVGGTEIELYSGPGGGVEVTKISSFDPLDHPELKANRVSLKDIVGQVDQGGSVVLDLGDPAAQRYVWELTGSRIEHVRRVGGAYMKRKFREAELAHRTYKLGQLAYTEQEFLKPAKFKMRTVMEAGANVRNAANFGNGALELRIAMKGELEGGFPREDWLYPIPSDLPGIDSSLIISNQLLMHEIVAEALRVAYKAPDARFDEIKDANGVIQKLKVQAHAGSMTIAAFSFPDVGLNIREFELPIHIDTENLLEVTKTAPPFVETLSMYAGAGARGVDCVAFIGNDPVGKKFELF
ncbi:hypothetical protein [Pseudomonas sp. NFX98]|uniref:hypothetical protein n=1 Tax=Pseudomonas sp. NFX98 TaxID=3399122 RepID=UPI0039FCFF24